MSAAADPKGVLHRYLVTGRDALLWKLDGLSEYDQRRPVVSSGTNLLGLVKHVASVTLGDTFGRPHGEALPWFADEADPNADMWAAADERRDDLLDLYVRAWAHADATIDALALDDVGHVPWWPEERAEVTLHTVMVHMLAEVHRHAGHADLVRELIDGSVGYRVDADNLWTPADGWDEHRRRLQTSAERFR